MQIYIFLEDKVKWKQNKFIHWKNILKIMEIKLTIWKLIKKIRNRVQECAINFYVSALAAKNLCIWKYTND